MRTLSDTVARLAALRARGMTSDPPAGSTGPLRRLEAFGSNPGGLQALAMAPATPAGPVPLVVVLHGCTQTAAGYDRQSGWSTLAARHGFALLCPDQQRSNNPNLCFNWFQPDDVRRDAGEALSIRQMIDAMVARHGVDPGRIFITGLSAGGAMAAAMLAAYPEVFAGGAIIAGLPVGSATSVPEAFDRMRGHGGASDSGLRQAVHAASPHRGRWPRISIWHGTADATVAPANAEATAAQWRGVHGLGERPDLQETTGRLERRVWTDGAGEPVIELNLIAGMGHGTPLGHDGLGQAGPFMLDVGISSTAEIARGWGLADGEALASVQSGEDAFAIGPESLSERGPEPAPQSPGAHAFRSVSQVIDDALRQAGLMR